VTFAPLKITDYATSGSEEESTLSVAHTEADADAFVAVFEELAADLTS
jgi:hypothetical protein